MISDYLTQDHRHCDEFFAAAEEAAAENNFSVAQSAFEQFQRAMERHFIMEEQVMFPRLEELSGSTAGPTAVMRSEHTQMRALLVEMAITLESEDTEGFLDLCETLLVMMQQHNLKEENMLYPMADQVLSGEQDDMVARLQLIAA